MTYLFTSESVSEGHPDKVADQISDAILDAYLDKDPDSRVAVETLVTTNLVVLAGEVRAQDGVDEAVDREEIARSVIKEIGYTDRELKFAWDTVVVRDYVHGQSQDIALGVDADDNKEQGAGDQGMMFGYACKEIDRASDSDGRVLMPMPLYFAHRLVERLAFLRKHTKLMPYLRPDSKSQVTVKYGDGNVPISVETVVLSTQHAEGVSQDEIRQDIEEWVLPVVLPARCMPRRLIVNPTGKFVIGGPHGDTGLTGRKIIVDTYGGRGAHGGGAFSGKDPSKVDRSAAYALRHAAKNLVAAGLAEMVEIQAAYAIGCAEPVSVVVDSSGTVRDGLSDADLHKVVESVFDLTPEGITRRLNLKRPIYRKTATYGHFGRSGFPWEQLDFVNRVLACADSIAAGTTVAA